MSDPDHGGGNWRDHVVPAPSSRAEFQVRAAAPILGSRRGIENDLIPKAIPCRNLNWPVRASARSYRKPLEPVRPFTGRCGDPTLSGPVCVGWLCANGLAA